MSRPIHTPDSGHGRHRFGDFTLDVAGGFLSRRDQQVPLRPKAFDALVYLVERPGRLVTKPELMEALWPDTAVTENSLAQCVVEIRRALGDESQQIIRTVARRGYVFAVPTSTTYPGIAISRGEAFTEKPVPLQGSRTWKRIRGEGWTAVRVALMVCVGGVAGMFLLRSSTAGRQTVKFEQVTHLVDSAVGPAVSPDGRMVAFIRGAHTFLDPGQVYLTLLPEGEPVQLTHDGRLKMAPAFSPDGSHIAYTVYTESGAWETWTVPVLGGRPQLMMANAAALSWVKDDQVLFSQITRDLHMTVVTATAARDSVRDVYVPPNNHMAHRSAASPDGRWVLVSSEMNASAWLPCRLIPMDGSHAGEIVGPARTPCTHAAWSRDGRWMYFSAATDAGYRTWRQEFPNGTPMPMTLGPVEEEGLAVSPDGRSLVSSVGTVVSSVWVHDAGADRQITSEGLAHLPSFSRDGETLYYLQQIPDTPYWAAGELWAIELASGIRRRMLPGISMAQYEVSADGARVVLSRTDPHNEGVWIAEIDGHRPPTRISSQGDTRALWGPEGDVILEDHRAEGKHLVRARPDGVRVETITAAPIVNLESVSPDRQWALVWPAGDHRDGMLAYPLSGGASRYVCERCNDGDGGPGRGRTPPSLMWSPDGEQMYARFEGQPSNPTVETGRTYVVSLPTANGLPPRFAGEIGFASLPGVRILPRWGIFPGPGPRLYAYTRAIAQRNLYRITIPDPVELPGLRFSRPR